MGLQESGNAFFAGFLYACLYWAGRVELCALPKKRRNFACMPQGRY